MGRSKAQGKPEVQTKGNGISVIAEMHVGMVPNAPGVAQQEGFLHRLTTGLRGAVNATFATGNGISESMRMRTKGAPILEA